MNRSEVWKCNILLYIFGLFEVLENCIDNILDLLRLNKDWNVPKLDGKVVLVTGATRGIGKATAVELVRRGARVILGCRDMKASQDVVNEVSILSPYSGCGLGCCNVVELDLACLTSIDHCLDTLEKSLGIDKIDCVICNAGVMAPKERVLTKDGYELQFQVNHLGHFYLVHEILKSQKKKRRAMPTRVILISSVGHLAASSISVVTPTPTKEAYTPKLQYCNTKLCNVLIAMELGKRMKNNSSEELHYGTAVAVDPGVVDTHLARKFCGEEFPDLLRPITDWILRILFRFTLRKPQRAARVIAYCVSTPDDVITKRKYLGRGLLSFASPEAQSTSLQDYVWKYSCMLLYGNDKVI